VWGLIGLPRFIDRGLGPGINLPWTDTSVVNRPGSGSTELGVIRLKPTMAGVLWQKPIGNQTSAEIQVVAGYSFNSVDKPGKKSFRAQLVVPQGVMDVDDSFAWETRLSLWRELGPRVGIMAQDATCTLARSSRLPMERTVFGRPTASRSRLVSPLL